MIIFLYGPDDYRREQKKKFYIDSFAKKYPLSAIAYFDLREPDRAQAFEEFTTRQSLFSPKQMSVLERVFDLKEKVDSLISCVKSLAEDKNTTIILVEPATPPEEWNFLREKPCQAEPFDYLTGRAWRDFIQSQAEALGITLKDKAIEFLSAVYQDDTWRLVTELEKLSFLKKPKIDVGDLEDLGVEVAPEFFELLRGLRAGTVGMRLATLEKLLTSGEPAQKIFHMLAYQVPEKIPAFAEYDLKVKSGKLNYEEALLDSVL